MIEARELTKRYGSLTAVDALSFSVAPGEVLGFLGPNGAGKTTTMRMLVGFVSPTSGAVSINGLSIDEHPTDVKSIIGYLPEGAPSYGEMTPLAFLDFIADIRKLTGQRKTSRRGPATRSRCNCYDTCCRSGLNRGICTQRKRKHDGLAVSLWDFDRYSCGH